MKAFEKANAEIVEFNVEDIVTTSGGEQGETPRQDF